MGRFIERSDVTTVGFDITWRTWSRIPDFVTLLAMFAVGGIYAAIHVDSLQKLTQILAGTGITILPLAVITSVGQKLTSSVEHAVLTPERSTQPRS